MSTGGNGVNIRQTIKAVCDIVRRGKHKGARNYIAELTWILFLRMLDDREEREAERTKAIGGKKFPPSLSAPYRWRDWASPESKMRKELSDKGCLIKFVRTDLFPHLKRMRDSADIRPRVIGQIIAGVGGPRTESATDFLDILDKIHLLRDSELDKRHDFPISRVYEELLLSMSQDGKDTGQFFTPREVIRAMVRVVNPKPGEKVMDPCCGTGGFLAQAREYIRAENPNMGGIDMRRLAEKTFYGREQDEYIYPSALANLVMHDVDHPSIWHGDTLTDTTYYGKLFESAPKFYDVVLTNPPFGAKLKKSSLVRFDYPSSSSQVLFVQEIIQRVLKVDGRCGMVVDEGFMFGDDDSSISTRQMLLDRCDLECVVSLPRSVFACVGTSVKTNLLFFRKGKETRQTWYYDLSDVKLTKKRMMTLENFGDFFLLLAKWRNGKDAEGENSWVVDFNARKAAANKTASPYQAKAEKLRTEAVRLDKLIAAEPSGRQRDKKKVAELRERRETARGEEKKFKARVTRIQNAVYDLRAINPNRQVQVDTRTPKELRGIVSTQHREIAKLLAELDKTGE